MAVKTQSLVSLIGSMTPVEKAYFKKYGFKKEGSGMSKMLTMFNICEKHSANESTAKVEAQFEKERIERVPLYRNRLFEAIIQSLREYQASKSEEEDLYHKYQAADILISRGLLKEAESILVKAIAKADELLLLEHSLLLEHKRHIVLHGLGKRSQVSQGIEKRRKTALNLSLQMYLVNIYEKVYSMQLQEGRNLNSASVLKLKQLAKEVELMEIELLDTKGAIQRNSILHTIYFNLGDNEKCLQYSIAIIELFNNNPGFKASRSRPYLLSMFNLLSDLLNANQPLKYLEKLPMLSEVAHEAPSMAREVQTLTFSLQLDYLLLTGGEVEVLDFLQEHKLWYAREKDNLRISTLIDYIFRLAYLLYKEHLYSEALDGVVEFFSLARSGLRPDLELQISVIEIVIHLEFGNKELAYYKQKALYQRSRNDMANMPAIHQFIACLSKLMKDNRKEPEVKILQQFLGNAPAETDRHMLISPKLMAQRLLALYDEVKR